MSRTTLLRSPCCKAVRVPGLLSIESVSGGIFTAVLIGLMPSSASQR
jgi:hypothetical protein